jgi:ankyrin repeat protein
MTHLPDARRDDEFIKIFRRSPFDHIFAGLLQSRGAKVNKKDNKGYPPLLFAARIGEVSALTWLKTFKADMNARDNLGSSALHVAAINGRLDAVRWLLRSTAGGGAGLDPNARNKIGATPLHWVVDSKEFNRPMLEILIKHGADPNAITVGGWRPIDFANNRINSGWRGEYSDIIGWLKQQNAGEDSKQAHTEEKRRLQPRDWNPGTPRQLVACPGGNDKNRQKVSADIFSAKNTFVKQKHNNQEDED